MSLTLMSPIFDFTSFFFTDTATTEIYTLSLHDALPISSPGHPIAVIISADCPFTDTTTGEVTSCPASRGNGCPGLMPGRVGPRPEALAMRTSLAFAGFAAVTGEKSAWNTAGPPEILTTSGRNIGIT